MKYIIAFVCCCGLWMGDAYGQIQILDGNVQENNFYGEKLYAIQDMQGNAPFGRIVYTPANGGQGWTFRWTYNDQPQPVEYSADSSSLVVDIRGNGCYVFEAERGEQQQVEPPFHIFFDHVPRFTIRLTDIYNCTNISIGEITDFSVPDYTYKGKSYNAESSFQRKVEYLISGKSVPWEFDNYELAFKPRENAVAVTSEDVEVSVTITDLFGFSWTSEKDKYLSVIPKADWEIEYGNTVHVSGEVHGEVGQAPLEVMFHNNSVNADEFLWYLYRDTSDMNKPLMNLEDSLLDHRIRTEREFNYTYENPGRYRVQMVAINSAGNRCQDTMDSQYVNVIASLVNVPNVFTPNGDGINDIFRAQCFSVESFQGVILNRWGRKIYEWNDPTGGWNGRINGKYASPGTYYYIITARGREKSNPPKYVRKGALLLVR